MAKHVSHMLSLLWLLADIQNPLLDAVHGTFIHRGRLLWRHCSECDQLRSRINYEGCELAWSPRNDPCEDWYAERFILRLPGFELYVSVYSAAPDLIGAALVGTSAREVAHPLHCVVACLLPYLTPTYISISVIEFPYMSRKLSQPLWGTIRRISHQRATIPRQLPNKVLATCKYKSFQRLDDNIILSRSLSMKTYRSQQCRCENALESCCMSNIYSVYLHGTFIETSSCATIESNQRLTVPWESAHASPRRWTWEPGTPKWLAAGTTTFYPLSLIPVLFPR